MKKPWPNLRSTDAMDRGETAILHQNTYCENVNLAFELQQMGIDRAQFLTKQECDVARALAEGLSEKEVALRLHLKRNTIHNYVKRLHLKLNVSTRSQLVVKLIREMDRLAPAPADPAPAPADPATAIRVIPVDAQTLEECDTLRRKASDAFAQAEKLRAEAAALLELLASSAKQLVAVTSEVCQLAQGRSPEKNQP